MKTARNFNAVMAGAAKVTVCEVEEIVEVGESLTLTIFTHLIFAYSD